MTVGVIGAGPAGLAAAYRLSRVGVPVVVFEADPVVGGLCRTLTLWGQKVDIGPHRFLSRDRRVNELWRENVGRDYAMVNRLTRIYYRGRFFHYPLRPIEALRKLGLAEAGACLASYLAARIRPLPSDPSFENWVVNRFGRRLFEIFFRSYSEKLWGIPCRDLDADFAAQRIKGLTLLEALKNAFGVGARGRHKTLADQFAYPLEGTGMVYERMARFVQTHGGQVICRCPVRRVLLEGQRVTGLELADGRQYQVHHVISTMPITQLVAGLPAVPDEIRRCAESLRFRNTVVVYLHLDATGLFPDNWLYVHSPELRVGRITNFRNWVPQLHGAARTTILALEYWCFDDDPLWPQPDDAWIALATAELRRTGLAGQVPVRDGWVHRLRRCYPVYERGYKKHLKPVESFLGSIRGLTAIGRYGAFKYNNQDHSLLMGILAAENIRSQADHDLWGINTDYEQYQEASLVADTGLVGRHEAA